MNIKCHNCGKCITVPKCRSTKKYCSRTCKYEATSHFNKCECGDILKQYISGIPVHEIATSRKVSVGLVKKVLGPVKSQGHRLNHLSSRDDAIQELNKIQIDVINGSLLGDGYITLNNRRHQRFEKNMCNKFLPYLEWHFSVLQPFSKRIAEHPGVDNKGRNRLDYVFYTKTSIRFTELRKKWYPNDKKIIPEDLDLTPLTLAIWFCDDGYNCPKYKRAAFSTHCFTREECTRLSMVLKNRYDVKTAIYNASRKIERFHPLLVISRKSYYDFLEIISPEVFWPCMKYKTRTVIDL